MLLVSLRTVVLTLRPCLPRRSEWLAANVHNPPMAKNARKMKNAEKLAAST